MYYINITSEKQQPICYEKENEKLRSLAFKCLKVNFVFTKSTIHYCRWFQLQKFFFWNSKTCFTFDIKI